MSVDLLTIAQALRQAQPRFERALKLVNRAGEALTALIRSEHADARLEREARALGAPWHVTGRMLANVAVDGVVGLVPLAGSGRAFPKALLAGIDAARQHLPGDPEAQTRLDAGPDLARVLVLRSHAAFGHRQHLHRPDRFGRRFGA